MMILMLTGLPVWSMGIGTGAPSFYKTLEAIDLQGHQVILVTNESNLNLNNMKNVKIFHIPKIPEAGSGFLYWLSRLLSYSLHQLMVLIYSLHIVKKNEYKISLVYSYEFEMAPSGYLLSRILKRPYVKRLQGSVLYDKMRTQLWWLKYFPYYFSSRVKADLVIMTDDGTKGDKVLRYLNGKRDNVLFLRNGIDTAVKKLDPANILNSDGNLNFVCVSRLQKWKRIDRSIDVFDQYHTDHPGSQLTICGDGPIIEELQRYAKGKKSATSIRFIGKREQTEVMRLLSQSDVLLSSYEMSNLGNPIYEAMINKVLVVTLNNGDTGKLIIDGMTGIISEEKNYLENSEKLKNFNLLSVNQKAQILDEAQNSIKKNLMTWEDRMQTEIQSLEQLVV